ncbi:non-ribosomal peptide synthetase [Allosalinactinospora lopnorensis]|uniref:non-ribosomal peptide synthetase n=1 Tax=Allosalinactinospora lopnorensis TaxID=1352348 RepID=UPI000623D1EA|nr:non-ribosomal peptide synthetase [Allosalinactinospora lopnorensis]
MSEGTHPWNSFDTAVDLLTGAAELWPQAGTTYAGPDSPDDSVFQSYPALLMAASRLLGGLRAEGLRPGDHVVLLLEQPQDYVPALWACFLGGFVPCPMRPQATGGDRWIEQLLHVDALLERPLWLTTKGLRADLPSAPEVAGLAVRCLEETSADAPESAFHRARRGETALLMLTSGSTGRPKAVALSHANLLAAMPAKAASLRPDAGDTTMNWIAFDHISAIEMHLLPMGAGAHQLQVAPETVLGEPLRFLRLADAHRVTLTFTPNFLFAQMNRALAREEELSLDLSPLRRIISGGEATVCATVEEFLDRLAPFGLVRDAVAPGFGMTETCAGSVFSLDFPDVDAGREFASLGHPVPGMELRIASEGDERPLPDGEEGELHVRGPMVFSGYLNNEEATRAAFTPDGWLRTGDRGMLNGGRLTLAGRSKDSIIVNGVNYFSHDLETVLERLEGVAKSYVAAFPIRPPGSDTEQLAVVFASEVPFEEEAELYRLLVTVRSSTVLHWGFRPALILPLDTSDIPKTSLGKIQRSQLRKRLEAGEFDAAQALVAELTTRQLGGHTPPEGAAETALAEIYAEMFGTDPAEISATASFFDLGGTSLDILRLKNSIGRVFDLPDVPVVQILRAPTVRELAARLGGARGDREVAAYDPLVPLQLSGDGTPLFCVHPGVGEVLVFVNLAKYFINERPFYALRARGFGEGEGYFSTFREMVDTYVEAIRAEQPAGPYAVAGYSYGGIVAFEIAKSLEARGERVDFVGIFNLPPHVQDRMHELDLVEGAVNLAFFLSLVTKEQAAELPDVLRNGMTRDEQLKYLIDIAPKKRLAELDLDVAKFGAWVDLAQSLVRLGTTYEPSGDVRSLSVFYAIPLRGTKEDWLNNQLRAWDDFSREENRYIDVPGEHYTLMGPDHVAAFQAVLRAELGRALSGDRP